MKDYRQRLYEHYVSNFKGLNPLENENIFASFKVWANFKYLPLLKDLKSNVRILELGCGSGLMLRYLREQGFTDVIGIDISVEQVNLANKSGFDAEVNDAFSFLDDQDESFDVIIAIDFIEHFYKDELILLFPLIHKVLKEKGTLLIQTPNGEGLFSNQVIFGDLTHLTIFTPSSLSQLLQESGFQNFTFIDTGPVPKDFRNRIRIVLWSMITLLANSVRKIEANKSQLIWTENFICACKKKSRPDKSSIIEISEQEF
jgi:2-polyprenyl-3-methyl-5-hydroxy-6-metoxy-1,4-benzoquinol methylase